MQASALGHIEFFSSALFQALDISAVTFGEFRRVRPMSRARSLRTELLALSPRRLRRNA
jgi:hypothetical protein